MELLLLQHYQTISTPSEISTASGNSSTEITLSLTTPGVEGLATGGSAVIPPGTILSAPATFTTGSGGNTRTVTWYTTSRDNDNTITAGTTSSVDADLNLSWVSTGTPINTPVTQLAAAGGTVSTYGPDGTTNILNSVTVLRESSNGLSTTSGTSIRTVTVAGLPKNSDAEALLGDVESGTAGRCLTGNGSLSLPSFSSGVQTDTAASNIISGITQETDGVSIIGNIPLLPNALPPGTGWVPPEAYDPDATYNFVLAGVRVGGRKSESNITVAGRSAEQYWDAAFSGRITDAGGVSQESLVVAFDSNFNTGVPGRQLNITPQNGSVTGVDNSDINIAVSSSGNTHTYTITGIDSDSTDDDGVDDVVFYVAGATGGTVDADGGTQGTARPARKTDGTLTFTGSTIAPNWRLTGQVAVSETTGTGATNNIAGFTGLNLRTSTSRATLSNQRISRNTAVRRGRNLVSRGDDDSGKEIYEVTYTDTNRTGGVPLLQIAWRHSVTYEKSRQLFKKRRRFRRNKRWWVYTLKGEHRVTDSSGKLVYSDSQEWTYDSRDSTSHKNTQTRNWRRYLLQSSFNLESTSYRGRTQGDRVTYILANRSGMDLPNVVFRINGRLVGRGLLRGNGGILRTSFTDPTGSANLSRPWSFCPGEAARFSLQLGDLVLSNQSFPGGMDNTETATYLATLINTTLDLGTPTATPALASIPGEVTATTSGSAVTFTFSSTQDEVTSFATVDSGSSATSGRFTVTPHQGAVDSRPRVDIVYRSRMTQDDGTAGDLGGVDYCTSVVLPVGNSERCLQTILDAWDTDLVNIEDILELVPDSQINARARVPNMLRFRTARSNPSNNNLGDLTFTFVNTQANNTNGNTFRLINAVGSAGSAQTIAAASASIPASKGLISVTTRSGFEGLTNANADDMVLDNFSVNFNSSAMDIAAILQDAYLNGTVFYEPMTIQGGSNRSVLMVQSTIARQASRPPTNASANTASTSEGGVNYTPGSTEDSIQITTSDEVIGEDFTFVTSSGDSVMALRNPSNYQQSTMGSPVFLTRE